MFREQMSVDERSRGQSYCRRPRKGNTLIIVLIVLAIIAILAAMLLPALMRARQQARKAKCKSQLKMIGLGLHMFASDHEDKFPESLEQLVTLKYLSGEQVLECPSRKGGAPGESDYVYLKGLSLESGPEEPVAFDKKGNHPDGRNVLFVDGHVQWLEEAEFQKRFGHLER